MFVKKSRIWILIFALLITLLPPTLMEAAEERVIRVGYTKESPFIKHVNGHWVGYGVDYLEKVSEYTKWEYRYVLVEESQVERALERNEIDLAFLQGFRENVYEGLLQSEFFAAYENTVIYAPEDSQYYYEDYDALEGATIGVLRDSVHTEILQEVLKEMGIAHRLRYFVSHEQLYEALMRRDVDVVSHGNLYDCDNIRVVGRFRVSEYYCFTGKTNVSLITQLDAAVEQLKYDEPDYEGKLYDAYFGHSMVTEKPMLTREETEYVSTAEPIEVRLMLGSIPLSYKDEAGNPDGIFVDFFRLLENKSGLKFDIQIVTDTTTMEELTSGMVDGDYIMLRAESAIEANEANDNLIHSIPLIKTHLSYIKRKEAVADTGRMDYVFAVTKEMKYLEESLKYYSDDFEIRYYDSTQACLDAVVDKEADIAIQDAYLMNYLLQRPIYADKLVECIGDEWTNGMCIVAGEQYEMLISIINKSIKHITVDEKDTIPTMQMLLNPYKLTVGDILYQYQDFLGMAIFLTLLSLVIYTILIRFLTKYRIEMKDYEALQKKIQQDELTGLYNRPYFYRRSREMINATKEDMCIVLMDIVNFQVVNDLYSMDTGDKLLKEVAGQLQKLSESNGAVVGRFTGDRFYMCMSVKEFYSMRLPRLFTSELVDMELKLRYGVFLVEDHKELKISKMCERAAITAHNQERSETDYIRYYSEAEHSQLLEEQQIENEMKIALEEHQFCVYIQPKYDVEQNCIIGGEALVRWKHPEKGMIPPGKFIGIFERNGFILQLDYYIWEETCRYIAEWKQKGIFKGPISVNVSRAHFYNKELQNNLLELINKYRINTADLQLEITESICSDNHEMIYRKIQELRDCGFEVAMDDFGSGYSSLNMLKEIPLDVIKMDLKFLDGGGDQRKSRYILESLIRLAQNMRLSVVVEGVETAEQVEFLKSIGDVYAQGYFYAKPVEKTEYERMISER